MTGDSLQITEIYASLQGESTHLGRPCVFVRLTGCPFRCVYCDTAYAFEGGAPMTVDAVAARVRELDCSLVEVTGGEPLAQPGVYPLFDRLLADGYEVLLETSGLVPIDRVPAGVKRIVDVKTPSSGESAKVKWEVLDGLRAGDEVKFVIGDRADYEWSMRVVAERGLAARAPVLFSASHPSLPLVTLAEWVRDDRLPVRVQPQLHKLLWSEQRSV